jgi:hypothetical protein
MPSASKQLGDFDGEVLVNFEPHLAILGHGNDAFPGKFRSVGDRSLNGFLSQGRVALEDLGGTQARSEVVEDY